jgi:hypothetical protein
MTRPRYLNSPRSRPPKRKLPRWISWWFESPFYEPPPILKLAGWLILILLSPVFIPLYIATTPLRMARNRRLKREAAIRAEMAAKHPKEPPPPVDPELERRRELAKRTNKKRNPPTSFLYDPISDDPTFAWAIKEAGDRATEEVGRPFVMGTCHRIWNRKKKILKEEFDIDWYSPAEMNPRARFD